MTEDEALARKRYYMMTGVNLLGAAGAFFGLVLAGRSTDWYGQALGGAIVLSALYVMAVVPKAMAQKWRTPPEV
ncbi:hypothetical protein P1X14_00540 [Sphingomonas sp. AOB5]|uniref:hypothetical protein n=1 Tax=Sphingomonas sp. AOB5 TaxID=3034017 RepID=UPI0023F6A9BA|nr:hypothetical protein [Sphingomonas sp. AOB5]MDF7773719.1 hypothetical protein [Sphingomonas sp. AOB5]